MQQNRSELCDFFIEPLTVKNCSLAAFSQKTFKRRLPQSPVHRISEFCRGTSVPLTRLANHLKELQLIWANAKGWVPTAAEIKIGKSLVEIQGRRRHP